MFELCSCFTLCDRFRSCSGTCFTLSNRFRSRRCSGFSFRTSRCLCSCFGDCVLVGVCVLVLVGVCVLVLVCEGVLVLVGDCVLVLVLYSLLYM